MARHGRAKVGISMAEESKGQGRGRGRTGLIISGKGREWTCRVGWGKVEAGKGKGRVGAGQR